MWDNGVHTGQVRGHSPDPGRSLTQRRTTQTAPRPGFLTRESRRSSLSPPPPATPPKDEGATTSPRPAARTRPRPPQGKAEVTPPGGRGCASPAVSPRARGCSTPRRGRPGRCAGRSIGNERGEPVFEQRDVEIPASGRSWPPTWSSPSFFAGRWGRPGASTASSQLIRPRGRHDRQLGPRGWILPASRTRWRSRTT